MCVRTKDEVCVTLVAEYCFLQIAELWIFLSGADWMDHFDWNWFFF